MPWVVDPRIRRPVSPVSIWNAVSSVSVWNTIVSPVGASHGAPDKGTGRSTYQSPRHLTVARIYLRVVIPALIRAFASHEKHDEKSRHDQFQFHVFVDVPMTYRVENLGDRPFGCTDYPYEIVKARELPKDTLPCKRYEGFLGNRDIGRQPDIEGLSTTGHGWARHPHTKITARVSERGRWNIR